MYIVWQTYVYLKPAYFENIVISTVTFIKTTFGLWELRGSGLSVVISLLCKLTYVLIINQNFRGVVSSPGKVFKKYFRKISLFSTHINQSYIVIAPLKNASPCCPYNNLKELKRFTITNVLKQLVWQAHQSNTLMNW